MSHPTARVVVFHAHPDDEAIFTGVTIRRLVDAGARVTVVTATSGEEGVPRTPLIRGETMGRRRRAELQRACELLGVHRLEVLGYRDSGAGPGPYRRGSLGATPASTVAARLARIVEDEQADALLHYDRRGIYGHVDHVQVHLAGAEVAGRLGISGYEATVDAEHLEGLDGQPGTAPGRARHVVQQAAGRPRVGLPSEQISVRVHACAAALLAKYAAMSAHSSQIGPEFLDAATFPGAYATEWFVRTGPPGPLESLAAAGPAVGGAPLPGLAG